MIKLESWVIELLHSFFSRILSCPCESLDVTKDKKINFDLRALPVETGSWKWDQKFRREKLRGGPGGQIEAIWLLSPWKRWFRGECTHMYIVGAHGLIGDHYIYLVFPKIAYGCRLAIFTYHLILRRVSCCFCGCYSWSCCRCYSFGRTCITGQCTQLSH